MKRSLKWLFVLVSFAPSFLVLVLETDFFSKKTITMPQLFLCALVMAIALIVFYLYYIVFPCNSFVRAINRAIHGDYCARFSCTDENLTFKEISHSFNRLMSIVEMQTGELMENRRLQRLLYENEKVYRSALELTCMRVMEADISHNRVLYGLDCIQRDFSYINTEIYDELISSLSQHAVHPDDADTFYKTFCRTAMFDLADLHEKGEVSLEYREKDVNGQYIWVSTTMVHMSSKNERSRTLIGYVKNIDARKRAELAILMQSQRDGLTGLYNKKVTQEFIGDFLCGKGRELQNAVIMLDIDNFKGINDTLGHMQGDIALMRVAECLKKLFRSDDIVGRIGGDEFCVLMKDVPDLQLVHEKMSVLCGYLNSIRLGEDEDYLFSGSTGVALYPRDGKSYEELYQKADLALYYAKENGKNRYSIYQSVGMDSGKIVLPAHDVIESDQNSLGAESCLDEFPPEGEDITAARIIMEAETA